MAPCPLRCIIQPLGEHRPHPHTAMRTLIALSLLIALSANKCKNGDGGDGTALPVDRKWTVASLDGAALNLPEGVERPWLKLVGGNIEGFGGCNTLMGGYSLEGAKLN